LKKNPSEEKKTKNVRSCSKASFQLPNKNTCPNL
jgi:hypothetical protein